MTTFYFCCGIVIGFALACVVFFDANWQLRWQKPRR